jgi:hypothetical protein
VVDVARAMPVSLAQRELERQAGVSLDSASYRREAMAGPVAPLRKVNTERLDVVVVQQ